MKRGNQVLAPSLKSWRGLQVEPPKPVESLNGLPRLTLGGALCGGFAGSFAGALLGTTVGAVYSNLSLGLDGALIGSVLAVPAGAAYGLVVALRQKRQAPSADEDNLST